MELNPRRRMVSPARGTGGRAVWLWEDSEASGPQFAIDCKVMTRGVGGVCLGFGTWHVGDFWRVMALFKIKTCLENVSETREVPGISLLTRNG